MADAPISSAGTIATFGGALLALFLLGLVSPQTAHAQEADIQVPLTVSTDAGGSEEMTLGLDPEATDSIDTALGEEEQPPLPPSGTFDARLIDDDISASGFGEGLVKDFRQGSDQFTGTKQHQITFQTEGAATEVTISWDLPEGIAGTIEDEFGGNEYSAEMSGSDSLVVAPSDPDAIVTLDYAPNEAPTLDTNAGLTLPEGGSSGITTVELSASDPDDAPSALTYTVTDGPTQGTLRVGGASASSFTQADLENGEVTYDHTAEEAQDDGFTFDLNDDDGAGPTGRTFQITVNAVNDPPTAEADSFSTSEDTTLTVGAPGVLENDSDPDGDPLTAALVDDVANGSLALGGDGGFEYAPATDFNGTDSFAYEVTDSTGATDTTEVTLTVEPVNDAPTVTNNTGIEGTEGASIPITAEDLSASDPDDDPFALTYTVTDGPTQGTLLVGGTSASSFTQADLENGDVEYNHTASSPENDSFTFDLSDGAEGPTGQTFEITVEPPPHQLTITGTDGTGNDTGRRLLATPSSATRGDLEDDLEFNVDSGALLHTWDGTQWVAATSSSEPLPRGNGFILYFLDDETDTITADGLTIDVPDAGEDQTQNVTVDGLSQDQGLHLLGNPYDVAFDLGQLAGGNLPGSGFQRTVQIWDPSGGGQWKTVTQGTTDDDVAAWQSFFVERTETGSGQTNLTFDAAGRQAGPGDLIGSTSQPFSATTEDQAQVEMDLVVEQNADAVAQGGMTLFLHDAAETGWDTYEASQLPPPIDETHAMVNSPLQSDGSLVRRTQASEPFPTGDAPTTVPLSVQSEGTAGTATLRWPESARDALPDNWDVELIDTATDSTVDLRTSPYSFTLEDGDGTISDPDDARFDLRVTPSTIPVELAGLDAQYTDEAVRLTWQTASETNNAGFYVQRTWRGAPWQRLGFVESKASGGTTSEPKQYRFRDASLPPTADSLRYRLRQVDTDGTEHLSRETVVQRAAPKRLSFRGPFPNPTRQEATLHFETSRSTDVQIGVYDLLGRRVKTLVDGSLDAGRHTAQLSVSSLAPGMYFVRLRAEGKALTRKLTVVR